ncbi:vicilin-like seed storage protein At2g28490 [Arachis duranensis]|uniref:Vicilin-like seed storage protein At2g28490 n=1 Tax=Arachis duranensis TaxID=130453 RepID=A0A6P4CJ29_ARADU|nr:vicilin-like seed storage protein At2g28490 [Arachis duranensis]
MGRNIGSLLLLALVIVVHHGVVVATPKSMELYKDQDEEYWDERRPSSSSSDSGFLLQDAKSVVKTEAGEMRVMRSYDSGFGGGRRSFERLMHIAFITMEPRSLFIPQYLDSNLVIFIRRGEVKLGYMNGDELAERRLKSGDIYVIPAGSPFYLLNIGQGQRLHMVCSITPVQGTPTPTFHSFYIGGGANPESILFGFDPEILQTAFNATRRELDRVFSAELEGPIVFVGDIREPSLWTKFLEMKDQDKAQHLKKMVVQEHDDHDRDHYDEKEEDERTSWSWRKLLNRILGNESKKKTDYKGSTGGSPDSYNLYDKKPDFRNSYGHSSAIDGDEYHPLRDVNIGVFHVNLTAGSMMAPHVNPRATEYGIILRGSGRIEVGFPNGTNAMNAEVRVGDVFFVPRFFPFCQISSRTGPLEFVGFADSAKKNYPQFLAGSVSLVRSMMGPELAAAFGVQEDTMHRLGDAQREAIILPSTWVPAGGDEEKGKEPRGGDSEEREREKEPRGRDPEEREREAGGDEEKGKEPRGRDPEERERERKPRGGDAEERERVPRGRGGDAEERERESVPRGRDVKGEPMPKAEERGPTGKDLAKNLVMGMIDV